MKGFDPTLLKAIKKKVPALRVRMNGSISYNLVVFNLKHNSKVFYYTAIIFQSFEVVNMNCPECCEGMMQARNDEGKVDRARGSQSRILSTSFFFFFFGRACPEKQQKQVFLLGLVFPHVNHLKLLLLGHTNSTTNKGK